jgi:hypothetical protein
MAPHIQRTTVDLSAFPDLVVIYLGMKVRTLRGLKTLISFGPKISDAIAAKPEGLLLHESLLYSIFPLHTGMRQYWRDFQSLETWARSLPIKNGGLDSCRIPEVPASGTKPTSCVEEWRQSTTIWTSCLASPPSLPLSLPKALCLVLASV